MNYLREIMGNFGDVRPFPPFAGRSPPAPFRFARFRSSSSPAAAAARPRTGCSSPPRSSPAGLRLGLRWFSRYTSQIRPFFWRNGTPETDSFCI